MSDQILSTIFEEMRLLGANPHSTTYQTIVNSIKSLYPDIDPVTYTKTDSSDVFHLNCQEDDPDCCPIELVNPYKCTFPECDIVLPWSDPESVSNHILQHLDTFISDEPSLQEELPDSQELQSTSEVLSSSLVDASFLSSGRETETAIVFRGVASTRRSLRLIDRSAMLPSYQTLSPLDNEKGIEKVTEPTSCIKMKKIPLKRFKCTTKKCGKRFRIRADLKSHCMQAHGLKDGYICEHCGKRFTSRYGLATHTRAHTNEKSYFCSECDAAFHLKHSLKYHILTKHQREKLRKCKECGKGFATVTTFNAHMRSHTDERPFVCDQCGLRFTLSCNLSRHKKKHTGEKPHGCLECGKRFITSADLKCHMRSHTGEKPYVCAECDKRFSIWGNMQRHMRIHTGVTPYICKECGKRSMSSSCLKTHMLVHSAEKLFHCVDCSYRGPSYGSLKYHIKSRHS